MYDTLLRVATIVFLARPSSKREKSNSFLQTFTIFLVMSGINRRQESSVRVKNKLRDKIPI